MKISDPCPFRRGERIAEIILIGTGIITALIVVPLLLSAVPC
mgnify:CR=1 FL=1